MYEKNAPDTLLVRVEARDLSGWTLPSGQVTYHLLHNESSTTTSLLFQIRSDTGEIYVKRGLDREQRDEYVFTVVATDRRPIRKTTTATTTTTSGGGGGGSRTIAPVSCTTRVVVRVLARQAEANYRPVFENGVYNVSVSESADFVRRPLVLRVRAFDREISNK